LVAVSHLANVKVDLSSVDFDRFDSKEVDSPYALGKVRKYRVDFDLVILVEGDLGFLHFRAVAQGKKVGEARLVFPNANE